MKNKIIHNACLLVTLLALTTGVGAQPTAFTYQGHLTESGVPANGSRDFTFTLYDSLAGNGTAGAANVVNNLVVTDGLFTTTLNFPAAFDGGGRWLQIAVRPGTSTGAYTDLTPRQPITSTPYAIRALSAGEFYARSI